MGSKKNKKKNKGGVGAANAPPPSPQMTRQSPEAEPKPESVSEPELAVPTVLESTILPPVESVEATSEAVVEPEPVPMPADLMKPPTEIGDSPTPRTPQPVSQHGKRSPPNTTRAKAVDLVRVWMPHV